VLEAIGLVIDLARDHSIETRVRVLVDAHVAAGSPPRMLVMNAGTWDQLRWEIGDPAIASYLWIPAKEGVPFFLGVPILVKDYVADMEVIVGV
jgi:hypothetical protein